MEFRVRDSVPLRVLPGVFHRGRDDFDSDSGAAVPGHHQGDGSCTAVDVAQRILRGKAGKAQRGFIQLFRLGRVDLEEGAR